MIRYYIFIFALVVSVFSCKKTNLDGDFANLIGNWKHVAIYGITNVSAPTSLPWPTHYEGFTPVSTESFIEIDNNAIITLITEGEKVMEEDFFVDKMDEEMYRIYYYGSKRNKKSQFVDVFIHNDTLAVKNFFPVTATSTYLGHGGGSYTSYVNYFKKQ